MRPGEWSVVYSVVTADADLVARFGAYDEDFEKDAYAARYSSPPLPIPAIIEWGPALGGFYAVAPRMRGQHIDGLDETRMRRVLPALFAALDAMRSVALPAASGYGGWRANGHTSQNTGESCPEGWGEELHPQLLRYQTVNPDGTCSPTGSQGGEWNAASGNSGGWQQWSINLDDYAGETVEISIAYISDWSTQNLGVFVDDVTLPDGTSTSFETGLDGWEVTGPPEDSGPNANNWIRTNASAFPVGASITTPNSLFMGFGFEGISTQAERDAVMGRILDHLLD